MNNCPICGQEAHIRCKCRRSDSTCKNGHKWHLCIEHKVPVLGHSDHSIPNQCTCSNLKAASMRVADPYGPPYNLQQQDTQTQPGQVNTTQPDRGEDLLKYIQEKLEKEGIFNQFRTSLKRLGKRSIITKTINKLKNK